MYAVFRLIVVIHEVEFAGKGRYDIYLPLIMTLTLNQNASFSFTTSVPSSTSA